MKYSRLLSILLLSFFISHHLQGMCDALPAKRTNGLCMLDCIKKFVAIILQYQACASDLAHKMNKKLQELDLHLKGRGYSAHDVFNTFCSDGPVPQNYFKFLDAYQQYNPNIALETELFMLQEDFCENQRAFKIIRAWFDNVIASLLQQEIDYSVCDDDGNNLLIAAAAAGSKIIIEHILVQDLHPDINATNQIGEDAFLVALKYGYYDVAQFLLQQGAHPIIDKESLFACIGEHDASIQREIHKHQLQGLIHSYIQ